MTHVRFNDRLQVFSLAGEHRRSITGAWKRPMLLRFVKDRLYLVEEAGGLDETANPCGRRIFVLSLQGATLQVFELSNVCESLCCFDDKLLATELQIRIQRIRVRTLEVLVFKGL